MTKELAAIICALFILWLFYRDRKLRPMTSWASWIPLFWVMIIGSKPVSAWFGVTGEAAADQIMPTEYLEGSPLDRNVFLILIIGALIVLWRRKVDWSRIFGSNRWLFAFFLYCGVSILWSDFPFISLKRWIKDLGNIVMVLVIVTETYPVQALEAVFARYINVAIPLSVLFVKYFPNLGRYYHRFTYAPAYQGVTGNKNELGIILFVSGLFLMWDLMQKWHGTQQKTDKVDRFVRVLLLLMVIWLMILSSCSTAIVCLTLGTGLLFILQSSSVKKQVRHLGMYSLATGLLIVFIYTFPAITEGILTMVGRSTTLTGRTDIWAGLLKEPLNEFIGAGFKSFWLVPARIAKHVVIQAHNGYLETYLNGGLAGLLLLIALIVSTGSKLKKEFFGDKFGIFRLSFFVIALLYNWTEAMFNSLSLIWFVLLITALYYPPSSASGFRVKATAKGLSRAIPAKT